MMKAVWYDQCGAAGEVLQLGQLDNPDLVRGEVRVRMVVSGVNPVDVKRRQGGRGALDSPRVIPHFDGAGVIEAVGEGVSASRVGERVWVYEAQWQRDFGTACEAVCLPTGLAVKLPEGTSFEEGACLGIPAMTAYRAVHVGGTVDGLTLLVTGGAGAVGRYAVQFAKLGGARVIATVSSAEKEASARAAGADEVINYRTGSVAEQVLEMTGEAGVDRIVEVEFGGNLAVSLAVLKVGGVINAYASEADREPSLPFYELLYKSISLNPVLVFQVPPEAKQRAIETITEGLVAGSLSHQVGPTFVLAEIAAAHEAVEGGAIGKVLLTC